jgi:hypothetical protein
MRISKLPLIAGIPLFLGACAVAVPGAYTEPKAGFANVASQITPAIGKRTVFAETQAENEALKKQVHGMVHRKTISADTAVQVALLNNKGLQASYANVGLSAADAWQESTPVNPIVSIGVLGIGAPELGAYRAIGCIPRHRRADPRQHSGCDDTQAAPRDCGRELSSGATGGCE